MEISALLAVLKAGAAYALLDADWPDDRLHEIIEALKPPLLIAKSIHFTLRALPTWLPQT